MELRHLRYFVAVADHGGLRHAANRLHVAQPAITRQIKDLEAELGFDLLTRRGRGVQLTDAGRTYLHHARAILAAVDDAALSALSVAEGRGGRLTIGLLENAAWSGAAPETLNRFARRHPDIALDIRPLSSMQQLQALQEGRLNGGFLYRQPQMDGMPLGVRPLRTDDIVLAASRDLVFGHDNPLSFEEIDGLPMIGFPRERAPDYHDRMQAALEDIGIIPKIVQLVEDETAILSLVSAGVGCAFVNSANRHRPPHNVQFREVRGLSVPIEFLFVHRDPPGTVLSTFLAALPD